MVKTFEDFIYMYYGNNSSSDAQDASGVWTNNYVAVWHLEEIGSGELEDYEDSTEYDNYGRGGEGTLSLTPTQTDGVIYKGQSFDGSDYINVGNRPSFEVFAGSYTISLWVRTSDTTGKAPLIGQYGGSGTYRWALRVFDTSLGVCLYVRAGGGATRIKGDTDIRGDSQWHYVAAVAWAGLNNGIMYHNGENDMNPGYADTLESDNEPIDWKLTIGSNENGGTATQCELDEVRMAGIARSADWIAAQYKSMTDTFINVGSQEESSTIVSKYTEGSPPVPLSYVYTQSTGNCLGTFKFDGAGTVSEITLTEYGTCDAPNDLENVKLFQDDDGDGNWESGVDTTQLGSTTTFSGTSSTATFSGFSLVACSTCYVHVILDVKSTASHNNTVGIEISQASDVTSTKNVTASSWAVQLGSSTIKDAISPEAVTTLSALTWTGQGEIKLTWTSPGDDGWSNDFDTGSEFDIRYSTTATQSPAISTTTFADCSLVSEFSPIPTPVTALIEYNMTVTGLTPGVTYYFAMKTRDEVPNWSDLSNGATAMAKIVAGANRYWVGTTANWNDADNWSATSGESGGAGVPGPEDTAIFDGGDITSCQIDISSTVTSVIIYSTYTATISINSGESLTTSGSFEIAGGTFTTNGGLLEVGSYNQTGGIFNAGGSTVTCNGNFSVTVGTFNAGASVLVLDATDGDASFTGDGYTFNNVIFQSTGTVVRTWTLGAGTITFNGDFQLKAQGSGGLTVTAITNNPDLTILGSVDYTGTGTGTESVSMGNGTWTVGGNIDFSGGTVDASTSTFVLNGTSTQTLTMDGNNLNILQITNSSSGVYFADNLTLSTFTATAGNTELYFCGGSTFTFTNIELDGQSVSSRIVLRSTSTGTAWYLTVTGTQSVSYVDVEDSDASGGNTILAIDGTSINSGNNIKWDFGPPAAITDLTGLCDSDTGDVTLSWSTPGDDNWTGTLPSGSKYRIDYSTYSKQWDKETYEVQIPTSGVAPHTEVSYTITGLTGDTTWYFQIWTRDEVPTNWSGLSNGATVWVNPILSVSISTNTINLGVVEPGSYTLTVSSVVVTNNGNIKQKFKLKIVSEPNATWLSVTAASPGAEQYRYSGIFRSTQPATSDFLPEDSFSFSTERTSSSAALARDADPDDQKGFDVPADSTRNLWFKFEAPTSTDITTTQAIPLTITAEPYP